MPYGKRADRANECLRWYAQDDMANPEPGEQ
jgi:hypothetical protein